MSQATPERILAEIAALPAQERNKPNEFLNHRSTSVPEDVRVTDSIPLFDTKDAQASLRWIEQHRAEYAGQYVALDGDRLVAHSANPQEIIPIVRASGLSGLYFTLVQSPDEPPFAGF